MMPGREALYPYLGIEEHVLANGKAQLVAWRLQRKSEQPSVVAQLNPLGHYEGDLLLGVQRNEICILGRPGLLLLCNSSAALSAGGSTEFSQSEAALNPGQS